MIFNIIDDFYGKNEWYTIEDFGTEFFRSNLIKKIDTQITDITGVNVLLKNTVTLYNKYIINENISGTKKIIIPLGLPYEDYYTLGGDLIPENIPNIDTVDFIGTADITVNWTGLLTNAASLPLVEANIKLGANNIGKYRIFNSKYILIEIYIDNTIITESNIDKKILNVKYKTDNIQIVKNTIPRLKRVNFI